MQGEENQQTPSNPAEQWQKIQPGLRKLVSPRGPWFQFRDPYNFEWNTYELMIHDLPAGLAGLRILQIADLHCRNYWTSTYDKVIQRVQADPPDLILFSGDMVEDKLNPAPVLRLIRKFVSSLKANLGIYAVRGNHDLHFARPSLVGTPCKLIDGQVHTLSKNGAKLELIGLPGPERENLTDDFLKTIPPKRENIPRIVLSHYPDNIRKLEAHHPDVYLAGHTHGGQICLPFGIPIIRHDSLPQQLCRGVHRLAHSWFVISRGLGFSEAPIRIFCPAEVIELRLVSG
jgi:predicted MPP superfamily phosphohydrolase